MAGLIEKLKGGEKIFATTLVSIPWSGVIEIFKNDVLDMLILDLEHGSFSIEVVENLIRTARGCDLPVIVRIPDTFYHLLSPCLDAGATGVLVPRVESVEQARAAVEAARFPPEGRKGFGGFTLVRQWRGIETFNAQVVVLLQIETRRGIDKLEQILTVQGIAGIIVGPSDLSIDLGVPLDYDHPRLIEAVERVKVACQTAELSCGIYCATETSMRYWRSRGMNIIWSGCATDFISRGYEKLCSFVRSLR
jgi:2-dehydro-3-deoxyglucarate aldolase/4-hydroxy-2-oxoheptanedioate aldolase